MLELKMCGGGYGPSYALDGVDQLVHYMESRGTGLGYLVVFDGRRDAFGKGLEISQSLGGKTITPLLVDVRPTVEKSRSRRARGARKGR